MKKVVVAIISRLNKLGQKEYLLVSVRTTERKEFFGYYYPPGGHVEDGETETEALAREIKEELNVEIKVKQMIAETPADVANQAVHWWECEIIKGEIKIMEPDKIFDAEYFTKDEILKLNIWPATRTFFEKYI